jgi:predicted ATPase
MPERPRITRVVLENYKSIAYCDVRLGPLTFLVGPNGSGKSNFLDALQLLADGMQFQLQDVFQRRFGFDAVLRRGEPQPASFGIRIEFALSGEREGFYAIRFGADGTGNYRKEREESDVGGRGFRALFPPDQLQLALQSKFVPPEFTEVYRLLHDITIYHPDPNTIRTPQPTGPGWLLARDASNSADVVKRMFLEQNAIFRRVVEYLTAVTPNIDNVSNQGIAGFSTLSFRTVNGTQKVFPGSSMSDGTLRAFAILLALFQSVDGGPPISCVGFEEPEAGLHPAATAVLLDAMREASLSVQVVASSHSADLLDDKEIDSDSILAVEHRDGLTYISPVDAASRQVLKDRLYTAGELLRMEQLRPAALDDTPPPDVESVLFEGTLG